MSHAPSHSYSHAHFLSACCSSWSEAYAALGEAIKHCSVNLHLYSPAYRCLCRWSEAYAALGEATKHKRDSWQTWENYADVAAKVS